MVPVWPGTSAATSDARVGGGDLRGSRPAGARTSPVGHVGVGADGERGGQADLLGLLWKRPMVVHALSATTISSSGSGQPGDRRQRRGHGAG